MTTAKWTIHHKHVQPVIKKETTGVELSKYCDQWPEPCTHELYHGQGHTNEKVVGWIIGRTPMLEAK